MATNHVDLAEEFRIPRWSSGFWGSRFAGVTGGFLMDLLAEGAATALDASWSALFSPASDVYDKPADGLGGLGSASLLPLLPGENAHISLRARLLDKWNFWSGSPELGLESILGTATGGTADVLVPGDFVSPPDAFVHWSRFWVQFPEGSHPVTGSANTYAGGQTFGDGSTYGPAGLTQEYFSLLKSVSRRYKPAQWVAWDFEFVLSGITYRSMVHPRVDPAFVPEA